MHMHIVPHTNAHTHCTHITSQLNALNWQIGQIILKSIYLQTDYDICRMIHLHILEKAITYIPPEGGDGGLSCSRAYLPTNLPTDRPTGLPTYLPTYLPTNLPTDRPTDRPSLIHALVTVRADYCNPLLYDLTNRSLNALQRISTTVARVLCRLPKFHHTTDTLMDLPSLYFYELNGFSPYYNVSGFSKTTLHFCDRM